MVSSPSDQQLRSVLLADTVVSGSTGLLLFLVPNFLSSLFGLPDSLLRYVGLALIPYALFVALVATRRPISISGTWTIIIANGVWAVASVVLLLAGWLLPNTLGIAFVLFQALVVAGFSVVQFRTLRRMEPIPA